MNLVGLASVREPTFLAPPDPEPKNSGMSYIDPETVPITGFTEKPVSRTSSVCSGR